MAAASNPLSDLMDDWVTVIQSKGDGLIAYEKYIRDAEKEGARESAAVFRRIHEQDGRQLQEIMDHVRGLMGKD